MQNFKICDRSEINSVLENVAKPTAFAGKPYPLEQLTDRDFEVLLYQLFRVRIEQNKYKGLFDRADLMAGVGEQGRDVLLTYKGRNTGLVQCKKFNTNLDKPTVAKEIIKFVLYALVYPELIDNAKRFTYYVAASVGFTNTAITLISNFNQAIAKEAKLQEWTEEVISKYAKISHLKYAAIEINLKHILQSITVDKITPKEQIDLWLSQHHEVVPIFFEVRTVTDNTEIKKVQDQLNLLTGLLNQTNGDSIKGELFNQDLKIVDDLMGKNAYEQALAIVEQYQQNKWKDSNDDFKYKLLIKKGLIFQELDEPQKAANSMITALAYNRNNGKAKALAAVGYIGIGEKAKAAKLAKQALKEDAENTNAIVALILSQEGPQDLQQVVNGIPQSQRLNSGVLFALSHLAIKQGDDHSAATFLEEALQHSEEDHAKLKGALGAILLQTLTKSYNFIEGQRSDLEKNELQKIINLYTEAWEEIKDTELTKSRFWYLVNRAVAKKLLDDFEGAYQDMKTAYSYSGKANMMVLQHLMILASQTARYDEVLKLFEEAKNLALDDELKVLKAEALINVSQFEESIEILTRLLREVEFDQLHRSQIESMLIRTYFYNGQIEKAEEFLQSLLQENPEEIQPHIDAAFLYNKLGDTPKSITHLNSAIRKITKSTPPRIVLEIANTFYSLKDWRSASQLYSQFVRTDNDSELCYRLVSSYQAAGEFRAALQVCAGLREKGIYNPYFVDREVIILTEIGDDKKAIALCEEFLQKHPEDDLIVKRTALLYFEVGNFDLASSYLQKIKEFESVHPQWTFQFAFLFIKTGAIKKGYDLVYETRRKHFEQSDIHRRYLFFWPQVGDSKEDFLFPEIVQNETAVTIEVNSKSKTFVIDDRKDVDPDREEIALTHDTAQKLLGKRVGDVFEYAKRMGIAQVAKITSIRSKYVYAYHESMDLIDTKFTDIEDIYIGHFDFKEEDSKDSKRAKMDKWLDQFSDGQSLFELVKGQYQARRLTIGVCASMFKRNQVEMWGLCVSNQEWGIYPYTSYQGEEVNAEEILNSNPILVLDVTALLAIAELNLQSLLLTYFSKLVVAQSTVDDFNELILQYERGQETGLNSLVKQQGEYVRVEVSPESVKSHKEYLQRIKSWCEEQCKVLPCYEALETNHLEKKRLDNMIGKSFHESILLAKKENHVLLSDDGLLHSVAWQEHKLRSTNMQMLLMHLLSNRRIDGVLYETALAKMLAMNYKGIIVDTNLLVTFFVKAQVEDKPWLFLGALTYLNGGHTEEEKAIELAVTLFKTLIIDRPYLIQNNVFSFYAVLENLFLGRYASSTLQKLHQRINEMFNLMPQQRKDLFTIILSWIKIRRRSTGLLEN